MQIEEIKNIQDYETKKLFAFDYTLKDLINKLDCAINFGDDNTDFILEMYAPNVLLFPPKYVIKSLQFNILKSNDFATLKYQVDPWNIKISGTISRDPNVQLINNSEEFEYKISKEVTFKIIKDLADGQPKTIVDKFNEIETKI